MSQIVNILDMQNALDAGEKAAKEYVAGHAEGPNWYPCGFVWLTYKCRKNAKEHVALLSRGWRWDDYDKCYALSMGKFHNTQSMSYKEGIGRAMLERLNQSGIAGFGYRERID
jgi:hypothetical protein